MNTRETGLLIEKPFKQNLNSLQHMHTHYRSRAHKRLDTENDNIQRRKFNTLVDSEDLTWVKTQKTY